MPRYIHLTSRLIIVQQTSSTTWLALHHRQEEHFLAHGGTLLFESSDNQVCEVAAGQRFLRKLNERQTAALIKITCTVYPIPTPLTKASFEPHRCNQRGHGTQRLRQEQSTFLS